MTWEDKDSGVYCCSCERFYEINLINKELECPEGHYIGD